MRRPQTCPPITHHYNPLTERFPIMKANSNSSSTSSLPPNIVMFAGRFTASPHGYIVSLDGAVPDPNVFLLDFEGWCIEDEFNHATTTFAVVPNKISSRLVKADGSSVDVPANELGDSFYGYLAFEQRTTPIGTVVNVPTDLTKTEDPELIHGIQGIIEMGRLLDSAEETAYAFNSVPAMR